ncbi:MAG: pilus assembly protein PilM [Phycisphaerales bacterium]
MYVTPIGLDIGGRWIKAVQLRRAGPHSSRLRVHAAVRFQRSGDNIGPTLSREEVVRAADVLARHAFSGRAVVIPLPAPAQFSCPIRLPARDSGAPLDQIALSQLADHARLGPEAMVGAWWEAPTGGTPKETSGFALGGRRKDVESMLDAFAGSGLDPIAVDARPCALVRACAPMLTAGTSALSATIDIGSASGTLSVAHAGRLVYERTLPEFGTSAVRQMLADELEVEPDVADYLLSRIGLGPPPPDCPPDSAKVIEDAQELMGQHFSGMARELQTSLSYAAGAAGADPQGAVFLVGGGALTPGLAERIGAEMQCPARSISLDDLALVPGHVTPDARSCSMVVAAGLALNDARAVALEVAA